MEAIKLTLLIFITVFVFLNTIKIHENKKDLDASLLTSTYMITQEIDSLRIITGLSLIKIDDMQKEKELCSER